jgi:hypothetical protein
MNRRSDSHDNLSARASFGLLYNKDVTIEVFRGGLKSFFTYNNIKPRFRPPVNPSNIFYYAYAAIHANRQRKTMTIFEQTMAYFLSFIFFPIFLANVIITSRKAPSETSSKQLVWVEAFPFLFNRKFSIIGAVYRYIFEPAMKKQYGEDYLKEIFAIYYTNPDHITNLVIRG